MKGRGQFDSQLFYYYYLMVGCKPFWVNNKGRLFLFSYIVNLNREMISRKAVCLRNFMK